MSILKIARMGHPVLNQRARELTQAEIRSPETQRLIQDMIETLRDIRGAGLAAPQVHRSVRLAIIELEDHPLQVFINPTIEVLDPTLQSFWEGCLSVPGLRGKVARPRKVRVRYRDETGAAKEWIAEDYLATVFQHEFDHLDGVLYVQRIQDLKDLAYEEEFERHRLPHAQEGVLED